MGQTSSHEKQQKQGSASSLEDIPEGNSLFDYHQKVSRVYRTQHACVRPFAARLGLGIGQPRILSCIAAKGCTTQHEIAEYFAMDPAAVSRMLATLKDNGFVTVEPRKDNRRANMVSLTPAGHEAIRVWDRYCIDVEDSMLAGFSSDERERFGEYLDRALMNLHTAQTTLTSLKPEDMHTRVSEKAHRE